MNNSLAANQNEYLWVQKYRPVTVEQCILPASIKKIAQDLLKQKELPNLLLAGTGGIGKCLDPNEKISLLVSDEIYEKMIKRF